jgi:hypothetical protein
MDLIVLFYVAQDQLRKDQVFRALKTYHTRPI